MVRTLGWLAVLSVCVAGTTRAFAQTNGLDGQDRDAWYHLSQGTEFFPLRFLLALNDADTKQPFMKDLERFGFIPDPKGPHNAFGLPVGMTADVTRDLRLGKVRMVGLNCAACHTAVLEIGGRPVLRADGGTNMFAADRFRASLMKSAQETIDNPVELVRFVSRLVRQRLQGAGGLVAEGSTSPLPLPPVLVNRLSDRLDKLFDVVDGPTKRVAEKLQDRIRKELERKPLSLHRGIVTREDDPRREAATAEIRKELRRVTAPGGGLLNPEGFLEETLLGEVITELRLLRARLETLKVGSHPVMTPPGFGRVDAFGTVRNKFFPEHRGSLDAPTRFPFIWTIKDQLTWYHWDGNTNSREERNTGQAMGVGVVFDPDTLESTIEFENLQRLEKLAMQLTPPVWPAAFGEIDKEKASRGAVHFKQFCAKCHTGPNANGRVIVPLDDIQTDPLRVTNIRRPVGPQGFFDALSPLLKRTIEKAGGALPAGQQNFWRPSETNDKDLPLGYPNRPLPAVWASPPYLHNGSVPNLYQLLLPAAARVKDFPVGHREYDPEHLGYTLKTERPLSTFDTRQPGNSNSGHSGDRYGTNQLTHEQRLELLEFLKTQ